MCGITARVGEEPNTEKLLHCLSNLEYRGYDSAGIGLRNGSSVEVYKRAGTIDELRRVLDGQLSTSSIAIGHTRWSTHGKPSDSNAHPHTDCRNKVIVVHNGIIENYETLREELIQEGHAFTSETDTEVVPHLIERYLEEGDQVERAISRTLDDLEGSYALAILFAEDDRLFATRQGSPLVLGIGDDEYFVASDVPAFLDYADQVIYLEDGDIAIVSVDGYRVTDTRGELVNRREETIEWQAKDTRKGGFDHYMLKEIHEQPLALQQTISGRIAPNHRGVELEELPPGTFDDVRKVQLVACGTSYHAAMYGRRLLARRGVDSQAFLAGEYASDPDPVDESTLVIGVTQSGETADTLESLRRAAAGGARTLALTNVVGSTAARECDDTFLIRAGPEIGVAATKTFSSQVAALLLLGERLTRDITGRPSPDAERLLRGLGDLPDAVQRVLDESTAPDLCKRYRRADAYFFIGRGFAHPVALEGALKLKEISYEHAEGFAAGELKHGPLALVTEETPVFAVFSGESDRKTLNNVKEVQARGAPVIAVVDENAEAVAQAADDWLPVPSTVPPLTVILANVQLQLVAYHRAALMGRAIDKPRNLAKSVTVE